MKNYSSSLSSQAKTACSLLPKEFGFANTMHPCSSLQISSYYLLSYYYPNLLLSFIFAFKRQLDLNVFYRRLNILKKTTTVKSFLLIDVWEN